MFYNINKLKNLFYLDYIFDLKKHLKERFNMEDQIINENFNIPEDLDNI